VPKIVLIVEDHSRLQKVLSTLLEIEGFMVEEAGNGAEALARVEKIRPDLILQDLGLSDIDGIDLARRFRDIPDLCNVPIIAMSGMQSKLELAKTAQAGITDFLIKPIEGSRIVELVRKYLTSHDK
jgi:CheY-like chemotaxis protein